MRKRVDGPVVLPRRADGVEARTHVGVLGVGDEKSLRVYRPAAIRASFSSILIAFPPGSVRALFSFPDAREATSTGRSSEQSAAGFISPFGSSARFTVAISASLPGSTVA